MEVVSTVYARTVVLGGVQLRATAATAAGAHHTAAGAAAPVPDTSNRAHHDAHDSPDWAKHW